MSKEEKELQIKALRELARGYRDANNALVTQLWDIDYQLMTLTSDKDAKKILCETKEKITAEIEEKKFDRLFQASLDKIKALEIELYGHSDIGSSSPYVL